MSREFKFRAWLQGSMLYITPSDDYFIDGDGKLVKIEQHYSGCTYEVFENHECNLMQYTGLKDKNGKEIYEGDIIEYNDFNSLRTGGHAEDKIIVGKVIFSCGMWMVGENNCDHDLYEGLVNDKELEIIGNIYENPELLEGHHE